MSIVLDKYFILPTLSSILLILTLPAQNIWFLSFVALVPLLYFIKKDTTTPKQALIGGTIAGLLYFIAVSFPFTSLDAWWWVNDRNLFFWENKEYFLIIFLLLSSLFSGLFFGVFSVIYKKFERNNLIDTITFPLLWGVLEYFRAFFFIGFFTWGDLGYALHNQEYILQIAPIAGVYGLSSFIVFINICIFKLLNDTVKKPFVFKNFFTGIVKNKIFYIIIFALFFVNLYGYIIINNNKPQDSLKIAVVHSDLKTKDSIGMAGYNFYMKKLKEASAENPDIVVLPENSFPSIVIEEKSGLPLLYKKSTEIRDIYDGIINFSLQNPNISILSGFHTKNNKKRFNSLVVIKNGKITDIYNKRLLLPLAEHIPGWLKNNNLRLINTLGHGKNNGVVKISKINATALICSEIIFPKLSKNDNSSLIINISNDSVFSNSKVALQNHIIAKVRAAENRVYTIRSSKGGISGIINKYGKEVSTSLEQKNKIIFANIAI